MAEFVYNIDGGSLSKYGDTFSVGIISHVPSPRTQETFTRWGSTTSKLLIDDKRFSFHRVLLDVTKGSVVRRATIEVTPSATLSKADVGKHRFGLLRRGNGALVKGSKLPSPWPSGHTGNWDMRGSGLEYAHNNVNFLQSVWGNLGLFRKDGTGTGAFAGLQPLKWNGTDADGWQTFGNSFVASSDYPIGAVRTRMRRSGGTDRPGTFLTMEIWSVLNATDPRTDVLLGTSDPLAWDDLPITDPGEDEDDWPTFTWPLASGPVVSEGDRYATKLTLSGGGFLPTESPFLHIGVDMGRDVAGDPTEAATNDIAALMWGTGGWSEQAHYRQEDNPIPSLDDTDAVNPGVMFQDQLIPFVGVETAYSSGTLLVYGEDLDGAGGIDVQMPGLVQLIQDYVDDPSYSAAGTPACIVIEPHDGSTLIFKELFSENDPVDPGMVLRITTLPCDWFSSADGATFSSAKSEQDWADSDSGSPFSSAKSEQDWASPGTADWFSDKECD